MFSDLETCPHISKVLNTNNKDTILATYTQAIKIALLVNEKYYFKTLKDKNRFSNDRLRELKATALKCSSCTLNNFNNNLICLQCPNVGCQVQDHAYTHFKLSQHMFGIDSGNGLVFCFKCNNYINNELLEETRQLIIKWKGLGSQLLESDGSIQDDETRDHYKNPSSISIRGLKGFINFGSTCFISSILQTFIHNPFIKYEFFNNDDHYFNCDSYQCITCSIDKIFTEFYTSDNTNSFGMTNLLINSWYKNKSLTGFEEQDAHEFWQFMLNQFHQDYQRVSNKTTDNFRNDSLTGYCECIKHKYFNGELESSIKCSNCANVTRKIDPIIDLSLELTNLTNNDSIYDCLDSFTNNEVLDNYRCPNCNKNSKPVKSLKIHKASPILSIQLKRFKHNLSGFQKNDLIIKNPHYLNLSQYLSDNAIDSEQYFYELFALVCHTGTVNTGHYIVIIKNLNNQWLRFDDSVITLITNEQVEATNAYLLFYIAREI